MYIFNYFLLRKSDNPVVTKLFMKQAKQKIVPVFIESIVFISE